MIAKIVRFCSWYTLIIGFLTSLVGIAMIFSGRDKFAALFTVLFFISMALTGWFGRTYGLSRHLTPRLSKITATISLIFGILLTVFLPILFNALSGFEDSFASIRNLLLVFFPMIISALAILFSKAEKPIIRSGPS